MVVAMREFTDVQLVRRRREMLLLSRIQYPKQFTLAFKRKW
jgi:hypothetical protein